MNHILIVEDEYKIARFVSLELQHEGYKTTVISDGTAEKTPLIYETVT